MSGLQSEWALSTTGRTEADAGEMVPAGNTAVISSGGNALIGSFISLLYKYSLRPYYGPGTVDAKSAQNSEFLWIYFLQQ